jgi:GNAT superfamily N-acetyltransferase
MSKFWNKMFILNGETIGNDLFISQERPPFFGNKTYKHKSSFREDFSEKELLVLEKLYKNSFKIVNDNKFLVLASTIKNYMKLGCEISSISIKKKVIGSIISFLVPLHIKDAEVPIVEKSDKFRRVCKNNNDFVFSCTSYLTLKKKYQGKGLGMALIQESLQEAYDNGCIGAYFINRVSRCSNSIPFNYYLLNLQNFAEIVCFTEKVTKINAEDALKYYFEKCKDLKIFFSPSLKYWKKWIKVFPTYLVKRNNMNIGIFSIKYYNIYISATQRELKYSGNLLCIGEQPVTFHALTNTCKLLQYDFLNVSDLGYINENSNENSNENTNYVNFYNCKMKITKNEFNLPIF